ncbi:hypothetical protein U0070_010398 [Myodes glareolus]|uniref:Uncharacterized protein n=1 Tax=Myodes glareolus TaxID=447135 RepID=A0AAW0I7J3_MYOGA
MEATEKEEISVEDEAVDKTIFRDCSKIAFYRRQKQQLSKNTTYQALLDSVTTEPDRTRFQIVSEATKVRWKNHLLLCLLGLNYIHFLRWAPYVV